MKEIITSLWILPVTLSFINLSLCQEDLTIKKKIGESAELECKAAGNKKVTAVRLTRDDLQPHYVLIYRDDRIYEELQNPLYKGRTKLIDNPSTDGKVYLKLTNLREKDSGTYICRVKSEIGSTRRKRATSESIIRLEVAPSGNADEVNKNIIYGVCAGSVVAVLSVIALALVFIAKKRNSNHPPPLKEETFPELLVQCSAE